MSITALIIAKNEEKHLPRLLASLTWVNEIVVVDNLSTDRTAEIAQAHYAKVISKELRDFSSLWNEGLKHVTGDWVFTFDADEEVPSEFIPVFLKAYREASPEIGGFRILRRNYALGRWLKHGQQYGKRVKWYDFIRMRRGYRWGEYIGGAVKLFRRENAFFENLVHEEVRVTGKIVQLQAYVNHYTADSIQDMFDKIFMYTTLHAKQIYQQNEPPPRYYILKLLWIPWATFFNTYIRKGGFWDGFPGLVRCLGSGMYEFLKYLKLYDYYWDHSSGRIDHF